MKDYTFAVVVLRRLRWENMIGMGRDCPSMEKYNGVKIQCLSKKYEASVLLSVPEHNRCCICFEMIVGLMIPSQSHCCHLPLNRPDVDTQIPHRYDPGKNTPCGTHGEVHHYAICLPSCLSRKL